MRLRLRLALVALLGLMLTTPSCRSTPERVVVHTVRSGENLFRIARYYGVPLDRIARANEIEDARDLRVGRRLAIPGARRGAAGQALLPPSTAGGKASRAETRERARQALARSGLRFEWPLRGSLTSRFGWRWGRRHEGIDLANRRGTQVRAAEAGRVIYSGNGLGAYGNVVIIRHDRQFATVYAHNRRNRVRKGSRVARGQVVAELGSTGNATGPHLHFEIRRDEQAEDPLIYLP